MLETAMLPVKKEKKNSNFINNRDKPLYNIFQIERKVKKRLGVKK